jgi:hypothetical protein
MSAYSWSRCRTLAIGALVVECITPEAVALTLAIQAEVVRQADEARRRRHLQVERAEVMKPISHSGAT